MARYLVVRSIETPSRVVYEVETFERVTDAQEYARARGGVLIPASDVEEVCRKLEEICWKLRGAV